MPGFQRSQAYGFEIVAARNKRSGPAARINRKFTPNQIDRIFCEFSAD
jgi:hypothetical protein